jgi:hypothetical protein
MAWFRNHYVCTACEGHWILECVEVQDQHCPHCRAYDVVPYRSDDMAARDLAINDLAIIVTTPEVTDKELVVALKATAAKMRGAAGQPRARRVAARNALH